MTLYWWSCPWCGDRMATHDDPEPVTRDRDAHIAHAHPFVVVAGEHLLSISYYDFRAPKE